MIQKIEPFVNINSLYMTEKTSNIIGEICFIVEKEYFPQKKWTDFIIIILGWWIETLVDLIINNKRKFFKLLFMDGSFFLSGRIIENDIAEIEFIKNTIKGDQILFTSKCSIRQLLKSIIMVSKVVIEEIDLRKWNTDDIQKLKNILQKVDKSNKDFQL